MNAIAARELSKSYRDVRALEAITLTVRRGEFYGLLGPNGAGKTTFLRILSGLLQSEGGTLEILGRSATDPGSRKGLGVVPQETALYEMLTAQQNLALFGAVKGLSGSVLSQRIEIVLEVVELRAHAGRRVSKFSGGMKRRLNLAVGLLADPEILLLDEPTVGVDPQSRAKIFSLLRDLHRSGKTIVYTTHYMEEAERLCERIGILDHGRLIAEGTLAELVSRVNLPRLVRIVGIDEGAELPVIEHTEIHREGDRVDFIPRGSDGMGALVSHLERSGLRYDRMEVVGPNLEALFLQLTGKELRD